MFVTAFLILIFIFGACIGSFTSVVIYRIHHHQKSIFRGRSACPDCEVPLKPLDLIPILSYLTLRGQCRYCSKDISYMYPALELLTGALFVFLFLKFPFVDNALTFSGSQCAVFLLYAFYTFVLLFTFFYDLKYLKIADEILLPAILISLIASIATPFTPHLIDSLLGAAIAAGFFGLQAFVSKGKWIGLGDLRIGAFMGVILGWKLVIVALVVSYLVGSIVSVAIIIKEGKLRGIKVPFAPMLVTGTFITIFFGEQLLNWYLKGFMVN